MSHPFAMVNLHIACRSLVSQNFTNNYVIENGYPKTLNSLGILNLYIACNFLVPQNLRGSNFARDASTSLDIPKLSTDLPEGYIKFPDVGSAFKLYTTKKSWNNARKHCAAEGGNLAVIDSFQKAGHLKEIDEQIRYIWVGFHRLFGEDNEWVEVNTGSPPTMIPWANDSCLNVEGRKCAMYDREQDGLLHATWCEQYKEFFCEIPI